MLLRVTRDHVAASPVYWSGERQGRFIGSFVDNLPRNARAVVVDGDAMYWIDDAAVTKRPK